MVAASIVGISFDAWRSMATVVATDGKAVGRIMCAPYGRIVVLLRVLIGGGFVMQMLQRPPLTALLLVALKPVHDPRGSRSTAGSRRAAAGARRDSAAWR